MKLTCKLLTGKQFDVDVEESMLCREVKLIISSFPGHNESLPVDRLKLILQGRVLDDTTAIGSYGLTPTSFVVCMLGKARAAPAPPAGAAAGGAAADDQDEDGDHDQDQDEDDDDGDAEFVDDEEPDEEEAAAEREALLAQLDPAAVEQLVAVTSFPEDQVRAALLAAHGNSDVAAEFLMSGGFPEGLMAALGGGGGGGEDDDDHDNDDDDEAIEDAAIQQPSGAGGGDFMGLDLIPPEFQQPPPQQQQQQQQPAAPASSAAIETLRGHPQFDELRRVVQSNPSLLQAVIQQIGEQSPDMLVAIQENPAAFLALVNEPIAGAAASSTPAAPSASSTSSSSSSSSSSGSSSGGASAMDASSEGGGDGDGAIAAAAEALVVSASETSGAMLASSASSSSSPPPAVPVEHGLSAEDLEAVGRLEALGFGKKTATEAFVACGKNEEAAANFLFDSMTN